MTDEVRAAGINSAAGRNTPFVFSYDGTGVHVMSCVSNNATARASLSPTSEIDVLVCTSDEVNRAAVVPGPG